MNVVELENLLVVISEKKDIDFSMKFECAYECCWSGEVRITPNPNWLDAPDISVVFYKAGCSSPDDCCVQLTDSLIKYLRTLPKKKARGWQNHPIPLKTKAKKVLDKSSL